MTTVSTNALLDGPQQVQAPQQSIIAQVAQEFGVHPLKQLRDMLGMRMSSRKIGSNEYFALRLFDPKLKTEQKQQFLGQGGINVLNDKMNPDAAVPMRDFVGDKLLYANLLASLNIPAVRTQAIATAERGLGGFNILRDKASLETFMRDQAVFPIFGKPNMGSHSKGSVRIDRLEGDNLHLGNGETVALEAFVREIFAQYADGYLLQDALSPHAALAEITGPAVGCVRLVTVQSNGVTRPVYAVWKIPAPEAMSDNFWQHGSMLALLDLRTGEIDTVSRGTGLDRELLTLHPTTGIGFDGIRLPFWQEMLDCACDAHAVFPEFGILGFDIAITDAGPCVVECNDAPNHMIYQYAANNGIMHPDFAAIWKDVGAQQTSKLTEVRAAKRIAKKARGT